jgi:hypothetical protein
MKIKILEINFIKAKTESVIARADIHFEGFTLKGFKIVRDSSGKEFVTPPSYLSPKGWRSLFKTDSPEDWANIQQVVLAEYNMNLIREAADEIQIESRN